MTICCNVSKGGIRKRASGERERKDDAVSKMIDVLGFLLRTRPFFLSEASEKMQ